MYVPGRDSSQNCPRSAARRMCARFIAASAVCFPPAWRMSITLDPISINRRTSSGLGPVLGMCKVTRMSCSSLTRNACKDCRRSLLIKSPFGAIPTFHRV